MTSRLRAVLRGLVIVAGIALAIVGLLAFRADDWPIYATYVVLSIVLFGPAVEVLPSLTLPVPGLALTLGFLYVGGLPIMVLRNAAPPVFAQLLRWTLPDRWRSKLLFGGETLFGLTAMEAAERSAVAADWATFNIGMAVRWWIVSALAPEGRPASHPAAMAAAELGGYGCWAVLSVLPILTFRPVLPAASQREHRALMVDLGLVMVLALTPFVFLIAYGYETHGLAGAAVWSLSALGLHFILQRLNERRLVVEEQNRRLEALNRELEHRERLSAIGKMSSVVSHQMLQQLGIIRLYADLIRNAEPGAGLADAAAQAKQHAAAIDDALAGVNRVLTDLLVFSRDLRLNLYEHPLDRLLAECVDECRPHAAARGVTLPLECAPDVRVTLDKLKVKQAVANVIRNAVDVSSEGAEVLVEGALADGGVEIAVSDRGPGVAPSDRDAIFAPFYTTKETGTGLGLAIAREFVVAHGGRIDVEARAGGGARFVLRLPIDTQIGR